MKRIQNIKIIILFLFFYPFFAFCTETQQPIEQKSQLHTIAQLTKKIVKDALIIATGRGLTLLIYQNIEKPRTVTIPTWLSPFFGSEDGECRTYVLEKNEIRRSKIFEKSCIREVFSPESYLPYSDILSRILSRLMFSQKTAVERPSPKNPTQTKLKQLIQYIGAHCIREGISQGIYRITSQDKEHKQIHTYVSQPLIKASDQCAENYINHHFAPKFFQNEKVNWLVQNVIPIVISSYIEMLISLCTQPSGNQN